MLPALEGAEPIASYAGLRPAGRGVQLRDRPVAPPARGWSTSRRSARPGCRPRSGSPSTSSGWSADAGVDARRAAPSCRRRRRRIRARALVAARRRQREVAACMSERAAARHRRGHHRRQGGALRRASCSRSREARRDKVNRHPQPGWVEQDGEEVLAAVVEAVAELLADAPGEVVACGLDHQGESVLAWDAESGEPLTPDRRLAGQALAGGARPAGRATRRRSRRRAGCRSTPTSPPPSSPGCSSTTTAVQRRPRRRHAADGHGRLVPLRPPRRRLRHRRLDRVAHPAAAHRRAGLRPRALRALRRPARGPARGARHRRRARHAEPPELAGRAARSAARPSTSRRRSPAPGASCPAGSRPPTAPACSCSPTSATRSREPAGGLLPTVAWTHRRAHSSTRSTAASSPPGRCSSGSAASSGVADGPAGARRAGPRGRGLRRRAGAARAGRDRRAVVAPERPRGARRDLTAAHRARTSPARRSRGSPGGSPTSSRRSARPSTSTACASTAGSPTSR